MCRKVRHRPWVQSGLHTTLQDKANPRLPNADGVQLWSRPAILGFKWAIQKDLAKQRSTPRSTASLSSQIGMVIKFVIGSQNASLELAVSRALMNDPTVANFASANIPTAHVLHRGRVVAKMARDPSDGTSKALRLRISRHWLHIFSARALTSLTH